MFHAAARCGGSTSRGERRAERVWTEEHRMFSSVSHPGEDEASRCRRIRRSSGMGSSRRRWCRAWSSGLPATTQRSKYRSRKGSEPFSSLLVQSTNCISRNEHRQETNLRIWRTFRQDHQSHGENASTPRANLQKSCQKLQKYRKKSQKS